MATHLTRKISFSDEQGMLLDTAVAFFRDKSPISYVREQLTTEHGFDPAIWKEMADLGWLGLAVPEQHGGSGLGLAEAVTIVEPMGRHLCATPFLSTQLTIQALLCSGSEKGSGEGSEEISARWLPRLANGEPGSVALVEPGGDWSLHTGLATAVPNDEGFTLSGVKSFVTDAAVAKVIVASVTLDGAPALAVIDGSTLGDGALSREVVIDETRRSYRLNLDGVQIAETDLIRGDAALAALRAVQRAALLLISAESSGGTAGALDVVVEYLNTRTQFGRTIGGYQALKHPTVDILIGLERSRSHVYHAASVLDQDEAEVALRMAKIESSEAFAFAGDRAIQFHGGFGFTYECDAQLYLRRALWCQYQFGDPPHHRAALAPALLD
jgi:alkylation response protein AidB-like acyl-CoA dehydrogenase